MKKILISALVAGCTVFGAEKIMLDAMLVHQNGEVASLYDDYQKMSDVGVYESKPARAASVSFYVDVDRMLGARHLKKNKEYELNSVSWIGSREGWYTGAGRMVSIKNGEDVVTVSLPECTSEKVTVKFPKEKMRFRKNDILEVCISWQGEENNSVYMKYFDSPPAPGSIGGTAMNILANGKLPSGTGVDNLYNKNWRYNSPAVRIRATEVENGMLPVIGGVAGGVIVLGALLLLKKRRKNEQNLENVGAEEAIEEEE